MLPLIRATAFCALAAACANESGGSPTGPLAEHQTPVTIDEVVAAPEQFVGRRLSVRGLVHAREEFSRAPCDAPNPADCGRPVSAVELQLITPGKPPGSAATLPILRARGDGDYEPVPCVAAAAGGYVCGALVAGAIVDVSVTVMKRVAISGSVVEPDGRVIPIKQATEYFLLLN